MGSISDVELTKVSSFLERIAKCPGTAVMADKGFTIKDMVKSVNVDLNIPPFVAGKVQYSCSRHKSKMVGILHHFTYTWRG